MTPKQRRSLLLALPVAILVGLGLIAGGFYFAAFQADLLMSGEQARGEVTGLEPGSTTSASGQAALFPLVTFETREGQPITFRHRTGARPPDYAVGEEVPVVYLPGSPSEALIDEGFRNWLLPLVLLGCGLLLTSVTFFGLWRLTWGGGSSAGRSEID